MGFLDDKYLLTGETAVRIFNAIKDLPIVDVHNHGNPYEILENKNYPNIWQVVAATDHYVWEVMRKRGVEEKYITGDAPPEEKWKMLCGVFPELIGNPVYEWVHLDLKRRLGIDTLLSAETAEEVWKKANSKLAEERCKPRELLKDMNVEVMCTTNDPTDDLTVFDKLKKEFPEVSIRPTWRPDKAMNIFLPGWKDYIQALSKKTGIRIDSIDDLIKALRKTHDEFAKYGCIASDHGIETPYAFLVEKEEADGIFRRAIKGDNIETEEEIVYMSYLMHEFAKMDAEKGWVMQLHIGAVRDIRYSLFEMIGPDSGGDISDHNIDIVGPLLDLLNYFDEYNEHVDNKYRGLKIVLYSLDPGHWPTLATLARAFGKNVALGAAWWFNDTPYGMKTQLEYIMNVDVLMNFAGMVTDSRKIFSYGSRTEMFRRILADVLGNCVDIGRIPEELAIKAAKYVCYDGPKKFFGL